VSGAASEAVLSKRNAVTIEVDRELCFGFGDCVDSAPGVFELDEESKSVVVDPEAQDRDTILVAAQDCPVDAIFIHDAESGEQLYP
jgi:ferredoxin